MKKITERMGINKKNPYQKSNISFWILVFTISLIIISTTIWVIRDYVIHTPICKFNGYNSYNPFGGAEEGYIICCRDEFIDHIKEVRCDAILDT